MKDGEKRIQFKDSTQQVLLEVGKPDSVKYKQEDKMRIHNYNKTATLKQFTGEGDLIWNYFRLGIDVLFDGPEHLVKKLILHTNFPGTFEFNR